MTTPGRRRKRSRAPRWIVLGVVCVLLFAVGIALGQALNDNPGPGHTRTLQRTLTLAPESSTVTVTAP